jgi:hypothetical protein
MPTFSKRKIGVTATLPELPSAEHPPLKGGRGDDSQAEAQFQSKQGFAFHKLRELMSSRHADI